MNTWLHVGLLLRTLSSRWRHNTKNQLCVLNIVPVIFTTLTTQRELRVIQLIANLLPFKSTNYFIYFFYIRICLRLSFNNYVYSSFQTIPTCSKNKTAGRFSAALRKPVLLC